MKKKYIKGKQKKNTNCDFPVFISTFLLVEDNEIQLKLISVNRVK